VLATFFRFLHLAVAGLALLDDIFVDANAICLALFLSFVLL